MAPTFRLEATTHHQEVTYFREDTPSTGHVEAPTSQVETPSTGHVDAPTSQVQTQYSKLLVAAPTQKVDAIANHLMILCHATPPT